MYTDEIIFVQILIYYILLKQVMRIMNLELEANSFIKQIRN